MQEDKINKNQKIYKALSITVKKLRGKKKISVVAYESELPRSVVYYIEQATRDPQLTTLWRLAEGLGIKPHELLKLIEEQMPDGWKLLDE